MNPLMLTEANTYPTVEWSSVFSGVDFSVLLDGVIAIIPILLPVLLAAYGIKSGWRFGRKTLKSSSKF